MVENNIMVNNGFHPHVWYKHSEDVVRRNIMWTDTTCPAGGMPPTPWGKEIDNNLVHREGVTAAATCRRLGRPVEARRAFAGRRRPCSSIRPTATSASRRARRR